MPSRIITWDWRDDIDLDQLQAAIADLYAGHLIALDTGGDENAIALSTDPMTEDQAYELYAQAQQPAPSPGAVDGGVERDGAVRGPESDAAARTPGAESPRTPETGKTLSAGATRDAETALHGAHCPVCQDMRREIERLTAGREMLKRDIAALQQARDDVGAHAAALRQRIEAVRALHKPTNYFPPGSTNPETCRECDDDWPCPTIQALGGEA